MMLRALVFLLFAALSGVIMGASPVVVMELGAAGFMFGVVANPDIYAADRRPK